VRDGANELVEGHVALAGTLAARYLSRVPPSIDHDAVRGAAYEGLCIAANSFDRTRGVPFARWAARRIIGAMRDEMREQDHLSRRARARSDPENHMFDPRFLKASPAPPKSLEELFSANGPGEESLSLRDLIPDPHIQDPSENGSSMTRGQLFGMVASLPDREFRVVTLRYFGGMRLSEIAKNMSLSETRVSQIEGMALSKLRGENETTP
jgi:RNA polymerase sigma factor FliA